MYYRSKNIYYNIQDTYIALGEMRKKENVNDNLSLIMQKIRGTYYNLYFRIR